MPGKLYTEDMAKLVRESTDPADKKYRPSNGTEGDMFQELWCSQCAHDAKYRETDDGQDGCKILATTMFVGVDDPEYPPEWTHDAGGQPQCTAFEATG